MMNTQFGLLAGLRLNVALIALVAAGAANAKAASDDTDTIVVTGKSARTTTALPAAELQKILPGINPLKAIQTLPGVTFITADPWGNNEQNISLYIHGFSAQQLGYTLDGVPLGDQNYGNYNGLSPQRAIISEDVGRVVVATGAAELATPSTSNLGGAIDTFSSDPTKARGAQANETVGSYGTSRTFLRVDSGTFGDGNAFYLAGARQRARAWDFNGIQGGYQANAKFVHDGKAGKLTFFFDYSDKIEPNEDATTRYGDPTAGNASAAAVAARSYQPYTRPFLFPNFAAAQAYIFTTGPTAGNIVDQTQSVNYRNYYSDAQRTDYLSYLKYENHLSEHLAFNALGYFHHNDGVGVVAGPLQFVYSSPIKFYYPGRSQAQVISTGIDNSGYIVRTTEYRIDRKGFILNFDADIANHKIELGGWYERNSSSAYRRWYALDVNNPQNYSPYIRPSNPLFTQYGSEIRNDVVQLHIQDDWHLLPTVHILAGVKSSAQFANGYFTVQPIVGSLPGSSSALPNGEIDTQNYFLPSIGATWNATATEQLYVNAQKNLRQFQTYGAGGAAAPWSVGSQASFDYIKNNVRPETSWTYEVGLRTNRSLSNGFLTRIEGQINYYHVDFSNRLLAITPSVGGIAGSGISGGTPSLFNVGSVTTNGIDAALTFHFGKTFSVYNAISYNDSKYQSDYDPALINGVGSITSAPGSSNTATVVRTGGKQVPGSPMWLNKTVATLAFAGFEAQWIGDYVGKRYATYTDDQSVPSFFLMSARVAYNLPIPHNMLLKKAEISINVTNLGDIQGTSTVSVGSNTNTYNTYPIPPRQWFATVALGF